MLYQTNPDNAERLLQEAQNVVNARWQAYEKLARQESADAREVS